RAEDVPLGLVAGEVADHLDLPAAGAGRPVNAGGAAVGVNLARQVGAQFLGDGRDFVVDLRPAEDGRQDAAAAVIDAVELVDGAGAVEGQAGLGALAVRFHEDGGDDARLAAGGGVDVDLAERLDHGFQLRHEVSPEESFAEAQTAQRSGNATEPARTAACP